MYCSRCCDAIIHTASLCQVNIYDEVARIIPIIPLPAQQGCLAGKIVLLSCAAIRVCFTCINWSKIPYQSWLVSKCECFVSSRYDKFGGQALQQQVNEMELSRVMRQTHRSLSWSTWYSTTGVFSWVAWLFINSFSCMCPPFPSPIVLHGL